MSVLGIDGGGTHTRLELRSDDNALLRRETLGAFNMASIGEAAFRQRIGEICTFCGDMAAVRAICIGGAGSSGSRVESVLREELGKAGFRGKLLLRGDHETALAGALNGSGMVLIAGTGSICCGVDDAGKFVRCGGWGHLIDDGGSAYAIGRETLSVTVRAEDGRLPEHPLHRAVMAHLGVSNARGIVDFVYYGNSGKAEIAALAPLCIAAAEAGDEVALGILREQARQLQLLAESVSRQLGQACPDTVLLGGLLEHPNVYSRMVADLLAPITHITPPAHDPLCGAAQIAWEAGRN